MADPRSETGRTLALVDQWVTRLRSVTAELDDLVQEMQDVHDQEDPGALEPPR
jgi:hypothetical protein